MRSLSNETIKRNVFAWCSHCGEVFMDDLPMFGSVYCPNKKCWGHCLYRGLTRIEAKEKQSSLLPGSPSSDVNIPYTRYHGLRMKCEV